MGKLAKQGNRVSAEINGLDASPEDKAAIAAMVQAGTSLEEAAGELGIDVGGAIAPAQSSSGVAPSDPALEQFDFAGDSEELQVALAHQHHKDLGQGDAEQLAFAAMQGYAEGLTTGTRQGMRDIRNFRQRAQGQAFRAFTGRG